MEKETLEISVVFPVTPGALYEAYLDSQVHSTFTDSRAVIDGKVGGLMTAWDGYISGKILSLAPGRKIVQTWRTTDFKEEDEDSILQLEFLPEQAHTKLILTQSNLPAGTAEDYKAGWFDYYIEPLMAYFNLSADK